MSQMVPPRPRVSLSNLVTLGCYKATRDIPEWLREVPSPVIPGPRDAELSVLDLHREGVPGTGAGFVLLPVLTVTHTFRAEHSPSLGTAQGVPAKSAKPVFGPAVCDPHRWREVLVPAAHDWTQRLAVCAGCTRRTPRPRPVLLLRDRALSAAGSCQL